MLSFVVWWAATNLLAFASFPIAFRLLRALPDRGYCAAKPLGILLASFLFWFGASLGILSNDRGSVLLVLFALVLLGLLIAAPQRRELLEFLEANLRYLFVVEALFLAVFTWFSVLRSYAPDILATEKQFEFAYLNGVTRTPFFPPPDTWLSGHVMNYYYFGWVNTSFLDRLTQTPNSIGFNLGTPLTAALAAVTLFGLVFGLVRTLGGARSWGRGVAAGIGAVVLLLLVSNLEGVLELMSIHGLGSPGFYRTVGVFGLSANKQSSAWYPTEFWFWWHATRMGSGFNIFEFPYFSFMLGDLHPHVMVMPFALLGLTFTWNLLAGEDVLDGHWWRSNAGHLLVLGVLFGSLGVLNAWDQPAAFFLLLVSTLVHNQRRLRTFGWPLLRASVLFVLPVMLLSILLYLPYWGVLEKTDITGIAAILISTIPAGEARDSMATPPLHLLLFWGPLFWVVLTFVAVHMRRTADLVFRADYIVFPLVISCLPVAVWLLAGIASLGFGGLGNELRVRGAGLDTVVILVALLFLTIAALMREAAPDNGRRSELAIVLALLCAATGLLWILGAELFWVKESSIPLRYNTPFKLWFQAWMLEAVAGGVGLAYVMRDWRSRWAVLRPGRLVWAAASGLLLAAALVYPVTATFNRTNGFTGPTTLDGLAFYRKSYPADYAAAAWISANVRGTPVELEAEGGELAGNFSAQGGRISELTGLPTVLAWLEHDQIHHGIVLPLQQRSLDIRTIYTTSDPIIAHSLLQEYGVQYVVVGDLERQVYGSSGLSKFAQMGSTVFRGPGTTIYDVTQPPPIDTGPGLPGGS